MTWIETNLKRENGLYAVPAQAGTMFNSPRDKVAYPIDFNSAMAVGALYMAALGDILNEKDLNFQYKIKSVSFQKNI